MTTFDDFAGKTAYELITENEGIDPIIDTLIQEITALRNRVQALENQ